MTLCRRASARYVLSVGALALGACGSRCARTPQKKERSYGRGKHHDRAVKHGFENLTLQKLILLKQMGILDTRGEI